MIKNQRHSNIHHQLISESCTSPTKKEKNKGKKQCDYKLVGSVKKWVCYEIKIPCQDVTPKMEDSSEQVAATKNSLVCPEIVAPKLIYCVHFLKQ